VPRLRSTLEIEGEGWEQIDARSVSVDDQLDRFQRLKAMSYKGDSLETYKSRFRKAIQMYTAFLEGGAQALKGIIKERDRRPPEAKRATNGEGRARQKIDTAEVDAASPATTKLINYPFPLRGGVMAYLQLPADLSKADAQRLAAHIDTLAIDGPLAFPAPADEGVVEI
jgi:hypothetical protein